MPMMVILVYATYLNSDFLIQGYSRVFKACANPALWIQNVIFIKNAWHCTDTAAQILDIARVEVIVWVIIYFILT